LEHLIRTHSTPQQLALRARIIVQAADGHGRARKCRGGGRLAQDGTVLAQAVAERRRTGSRSPSGWPMHQRSGAPATFTPEQICALVAMTCEKPSESERAHQPLEPARDCRRSDATRAFIPEHLAALGGAFLKKKPTSSRIASATG